MRLPIIYETCEFSDRRLTRRMYRRAIAPNGYESDAYIVTKEGRIRWRGGHYRLIRTRTGWGRLTVGETLARVMDLYKWEKK